MAEERLGACCLIHDNLIANHMGRKLYPPQNHPQRLVDFPVSALYATAVVKSEGEVRMDSAEIIWRQSQAR